MYIYTSKINKNYHNLKKHTQTNKHTKTQNAKKNQSQRGVQNSTCRGGFLPAEGGRPFCFNCIC